MEISREKGRTPDAPALNLFAFLLGAIATLTVTPLSAQTRVGEAAVVKNEVLRVAGSATSRGKTRVRSPSQGVQETRR